MFQVVEGWTGPLDFALEKIKDGVASAVPLAGCTVAIVARNAKGTVTLAGAVSVVDPPSAGIVRFTPTATDLKVADSPLFIRFQVTDVESKIVYFPNGNPFQWTILPC